MQETTPYWADIAFPVLAFVLTIVGPVFVALWVIVKTLRDKEAYQRESEAAAAGEAGAADGENEGGSRRRKKKR
ncbi:MAG: hypothetical protein AB2A00_20340 [Myxococcota bacterium]